MINTNQFEYNFVTHSRYIYISYGRIKNSMWMTTPHTHTHTHSLSQACAMFFGRRYWKCVCAHDIWSVDVRFRGVRVVLVVFVVVVVGGCVLWKYTLSIWISRFFFVRSSMMKNTHTHINNSFQCAVGPVKRLAVHFALIFYGFPITTCLFSDSQRLRRCANDYRLFKGRSRSVTVPCWSFPKCQFEWLGGGGVIMVYSRVRNYEMI